MMAFLISTALRLFVVVQGGASLAEYHGIVNCT
jgi:hypothetical protein